MADTNAELSALKQPPTPEDEEDQEMVTLQYGNALLQPMTPADRQELALALSQTQQSGFMQYGQSSPFNPAELHYANVQGNSHVKRAPKPAAKEGQGETKKQKRKKVNHALPPALAAFKYEHKDRLIFAEEENPDAKNKGKGDIGPFKVVIKAITGSHKKNNYQEHDLRELRSEQIRAFALNIGCSRVGSLSKFHVRKEIALRIDLGTVYDQVNVPSVRTTAEEKKLNSLLRIINACFLPSTVDRLITLNDVKKRDDYEAAHGGSPVKDFWLEISTIANDGEDAEVRTLLHTSEDKRISNWQLNGEVNLGDFNVQTFKSVKSHMSDLFKCRRTIQESKGESGTHADNTWLYCNGKHLKPRKGVDMPDKAVYYFDKCCAGQPDIDAAFTDVLAANLKSDSSEEPANKEGKVPSANKAKEDFLKAIEKTSEDARAANEIASSQRAAMIELQKKEFEEKTNSMMWSEYAKLSDTYVKMKESGGNVRLLRNLAKRVSELEGKIGINLEDSVVEE